MFAFLDLTSNLLNCYPHFKLYLDEAAEKHFETGDTIDNNNPPVVYIDSPQWQYMMIDPYQLSVQKK
jgi:hypothetical protein